MIRFSFLLLLSGALASTAVAQGQFRTILQNRDTTLSPPEESYVHSYGSYGDLVSGNGSADSWNLNIAGSFVTAEFEYDGQYRVMLQNRDTGPGNGGDETYIWTFDTYDDLIAGAGSADQWQINVSGDYRTVGLAYDGQYRVMLQNRSTSPGVVGESFIWTFATYADLVAGNGTADEWGVNVAGTFQTAGMTYDGQYRVMLQNRDTGPGNGGDETYIWTYDTYDDLIAGVGSVDQWQVDVAGTYSTVGLAYEPVPEPATMAVLGLGALAALRRRRKAA